MDREAPQHDGTRSETRERAQSLGARAPQLALDPLTGLANRRLFDYQGEKAMAMAQRHHDDLALVLLRIDNLEDFALRAGVARAKALLHAVGSQLSDNLRCHDIAGRLSRSRFGMLLPGAREFGGHKTAVRLLRLLQAADGDCAQCVFSVAASATNSHNCERFGDLCAHAGERLELAMAAGGNRIISSFNQ